LFDNGWAGIAWPKAYGGRGETARHQGIFNQGARRRYDVQAGIFSVGIGMTGPTLIAHGTEEQKQRYLRPMLPGDEVWCQLFSEPGAGFRSRRVAHDGGARRRRVDRQRAEGVELGGAHTAIGASC
jgi:alkylation response protein AidB-like acyl-CoA dehydrogenase